MSGLAFQFISALRFRLLALVLAACAPLFILTLHGAWQSRRQRIAEWQLLSQKLAQVACREDQQVVGATRQFLLALAESAPVQADNPQACRKLFDELLSSHPRYGNLGVVLTNGQVLASVLPLLAGKDDSDLPLLRKVLETGSFAVGAFPSTRETGRPLIHLAYPVYDRTGRIRAAVFAALDLSWFARFGSDLPSQLPRGATWTAVDKAGRILIRHPQPEDWIGKAFPRPDLLQTARRGSADVTLVTGDKPNESELAAFAMAPSQLTGQDLTTILTIPKKVLFAETDRLLIRHLTLLGVALLLAMGLGWAGSRVLILRPVKALVQSSARLARGDLSARTGLAYGHDELGKLGRAFDQMAEALEHRESERLRASQKLQMLSQRLVQVQENERRRIARELHDEVGQNLTVAEMNLQAALKASSDGPLRRRLQESLRAVEGVLEQVHDLSLNLRPSMLDDLGLESALRWYSQRQAALGGFDVQFKSAGLARRLDPVVETECFRVAQEALTNVVRHAAARSVLVELTDDRGELHLRVKDDGVGFDVAALRENAIRGSSLGLLSMEERATLAGGGFRNTSAPGRGTEVHAWFPLKVRAVDNQELT